MYTVNVWNLQDIYWKYTLRRDRQGIWIIRNNMTRLITRYIVSYNMTRPYLARIIRLRPLFILYGL